MKRFICFNTKRNISLNCSDVLTSSRSLLWGSGQRRLQAYIHAAYVQTISWTKMKLRRRIRAHFWSHCLNQAVCAALI